MLKIWPTLEEKIRKYVCLPINSFAADQTFLDLLRLGILELRLVRGPRYRPPPLLRRVHTKKFFLLFSFEIIEPINNNLIISSTAKNYLIKLVVIFRFESYASIRISDISTT